MLSVYIASPFAEWPTAASLRAYLRAHGIECTSSWIDHAAALLGAESLAVMDDDTRRKIAARNDADVLDADVVVSLCFADGGTEQYEECGFARAKGKTVVYVDHGRVAHLSVYRESNRYVGDWGSLICELATLREGRAA